MSATLVISDVHANPWALDAVLDDAYARFSLSEIWFLGDLFGYGPEPYRVWNKLCKNPVLPLTQLVGNHDWGFIRRIEGPKMLNNIGDTGAWISHYRKQASDVIALHQALLKSKKPVWSSFSSLPAMHSPRPGVYLVHGEVTDTPEKSIEHYTIHPLLTPDEMVSKFTGASHAFPGDVILPDGHAEVPPLIFVCGHTHLQRLWRWDPVRAEWQSQTVDQPCNLRTLAGSPILFNPGSVGFPRDGLGCPAYAVIDWDHEMLFFHHIWYDTTSLREAMAVEPYLGLISDPQFFIEPHCQENA